MPTKQEALIELYKRGKLSDRERQIVEEMDRRGLLSLQKPDYLQESLQELASEIGPMRSFLIGTGEGMTNVGRGIGLVDPATEIEKKSMQALKDERPISTTAGQIVGEAAPFLIPGTAAARIGSLAGRAAAMGGIGAAEGGIIQSGRGENVEQGALVGGGFAVGAELLFPVLGRVGRKVIQRVTGKAPAGAILDEAGSPTQEFQEALNASGVTFDELKEGVRQTILQTNPQAEAEQVARKAMFEQEGVPITKGELARDYGQIATEQRLFESSQDTAAEPLRQFRLKQSEAIKENLQNLIGPEVTKDETGQLIQDALSGKKKLLRTQKNELYKKADELAKDKGGIPVFTDSLADVIPDERTLRRINRISKNRISKGGADDVLEALAEFGVIEPTQKMIDRGVDPTPLTIGNFEDLRQELLSLGRGDPTNSVKVLTGPLTEALDREVDELALILGETGMSKEIVQSLKQARAATKRLKTDFAKQGFVDRLIQHKGDSFDMVVEASKVYDKVVARSVPSEQVNRTINLLKEADNGQQAIASLQATVLMDLVDAGFGTESRKVSGVKTFNPIAFKNRLKNIGEDKVSKIFENNREGFKKIRNIDKIASELVPPSGAVPKGSATTIMDYLNGLGIASISAKMPGGALFAGALQNLSRPVVVGREVKQALAAEPDVIPVRNLIENRFPGIGSALGIAALHVKEEDNE